MSALSSLAAPRNHLPAHLIPLGHGGRRLSKGATRAGCGVGGVGLQERHLYSRTNFKINRAVALAEWRQLLSA